jgi:hypothetical protein
MMRQRHPFDVPEPERSLISGSMKPSLPSPILKHSRGTPRRSL